MFMLRGASRIGLRASAGFCVGAAAAVASAQPVPFAATTIDSSRSGDCKMLADVLGDGRRLPVLGGSSLVWYEPTGGSAFTARTIRSTALYSEFSTDGQAADLDGDGDADLVMGDGGGSGNVVWFENPRLNTPSGLGSDPRVGGNWRSHVIGTHGNWVHDVEVGDIDGDGSNEVVTSGHGYTRVFKRPADAYATWTGANLSGLNGAGTGVFLADIDRDGRLDLCTNSGWWKSPTNPISGTWTAYPISSGTGDEVLAADFNADGRIDIAMCNAHSRTTFAWFQQPADPTSPAWTRRTIDASMGAHHPESADFNGDGRPDILMGLELQELSIYFNQGGSPPTFVKQQLATNAAHNARAGDINGDGSVDVFGCDYIGNPPARVFINQLVVCSGPAVTGQPQSGNACAGGTTALRVVAGGGGTLAYRWEWRLSGSAGWSTVVGGVNGGGNGTFVAQGAGSATLTVGPWSDPAQTPAVDFRVIASNACGSATSATAVLTVCEYDLDCDGALLPADVAVAVSTWFAGLAQGSAEGDFDEDGDVTPADLARYASFWYAALQTGC